MSKGTLLKCLDHSAGCICGSARITEYCTRNVCKGHFYRVLWAQQMQPSLPSGIWDLTPCRCRAAHGPVSRLGTASTSASSARILWIRWLPVYEYLTGAEKPSSQHLSLAATNESQRPHRSWAASVRCTRLSSGWSPEL
jgi:hypothetical protein